LTAPRPAAHPAAGGRSTGKETNKLSPRLVLSLHKENRRDRRLARNQNAKRQNLVVVRERGGSTITGVFKSEGAALGWIKSRVAPETQGQGPAGLHAPDCRCDRLFRPSRKGQSARQRTHAPQRQSHCLGPGVIAAEHPMPEPHQPLSGAQASLQPALQVRLIRGGIQ